MAHSAAGLQTPSEDECPICRSTLTDPHHPDACSHVFCVCVCSRFCRQCLTRSLMSIPHCPVCRAEARVDDIRPVRVKTRVMVIRLGQPLPGLSGLSTPATRSVAGDVQRLLQIASKTEGRSLANQTPAVTTAPPPPAPRPLHRPLSSSITPPAPTNDVCPVCASLPHGNPNQISRDFIIHLNLRHCYYTKDYTNINQTDTLNLQDAIIESLRDANLNPR
ncbi:unnamed protein product [Coregonus sp. 'balchen']|nr:unnamed protein product [Coregonus sp. 'balchen']